jgi:ech hydrogenase subunit A
MMILIIFLAIAWRLKGSLVAVLACLQMAAIIYELASGHETPGRAFFSDQLSVIMSLVINIVGGIIVLYGIRYMRDHEHHLNLQRSKQPRFFFFMILFLIAMNGLIFADALTWLAFFWEITTLCCFALIAHDGTDLAVRNAHRALKMNLFGGVAMSAAIVILGRLGYPAHLSDLLSMSTGAFPKIILLPVALLCLTGFTKSAQLPFQSWLLGAMVAPTPVSALLHSSTMVKAGVYLVLRLAPLYRDTALSSVVALVGGLSFLVTAILAIGQTNAKKVLAYSTISNLGLIILCAGLNTPLAITAGLMVLVFHAISKGLLFMCAGAIEHLVGSREIEDQEGLLAKNPLAARITLIGIIMMFLPPAGMLIGKWVAIEASGGFLPIMIILTLGSALTAVYWAKWAGKILLAPPETKPEPKPLAFGYSAPLIILVAMGIVMSVFVAPVTRYLISPAVLSPAVITHQLSLASAPAAGGILGLWSPLPVIGLLVPAVFIFMALSSLRRQDLRPVYLCGENMESRWGDERIRFRCLSPEGDELKLGGFYFLGFLNEAALSKYADVIGALLLIILMEVTIL